MAEWEQYLMQTPEELALQQEEERKQRLIAGLGDAVKGGPSAFEFFSGKFNPDRSSNLSVLDKKLQNEQDRALKMKDMFATIKSAEERNKAQQAFEWQKLLEGKKLDQMEKEKEMGFKASEAQKDRDAAAKKLQEQLDTKTQQEKKLSANDVAKLTEGSILPSQLEELGKDFLANEDIIGPIAGRFHSNNPYNERAQALQSKTKAIAQAVGKYLEGGVLRAEDVPKYEAMLPKMTDTPEVAQAKRQNVQRMVSQKYNKDAETLKAQGFKPEGISSLEVPESPEILKNTLSGQKTKTLVKKQHNKAQQKTKLIYSDGSEEIVDGLQ